MIEYAKIKDGKVVEIRQFPSRPDVIRNIGGLPELRPLIRLPVPSYDKELEKLGPWQYTVYPERVDAVYSVHPLSQDEIQEKIVHELYRTDVGVPRVVDDLVDALVLKGVITLDDLGASAKEKLNHRKSLRAKL